MDTEYGYSYGHSRNPMATGAVVLGVISLFTCMVFYIAVPCGAMAVLLAVLSRGKEPMPRKSKTGIVCGMIGMCLSIAVTLASVWMVLTNAQMRAYMESYLQYYLGDASFDLDKELGTMFPALKNVLGLDDSDIDGSSPAEDSGGTIDQLSPSEDKSDTDDKNNAARDHAADDTPDTPSRRLPSGKGDFI